ncbi:3-keto-disaccharide hydrolase [Marinimicrobium alkaliphilum]|uniref:3-keto-disaccharide hydrolase n=1 Tax=Marinimicrobium alkaliphilum TaxID=2202654 RepID=UPI000DBA7374|nr:DUF1080 domain-containing protein [Marinimicrobium alkaliphilum]
MQTFPSLSRLKLVGVAVCLLPLACSNDAPAADDEELEPWQQAEKTQVWDPEPRTVTARPGEPPSDAIVLFDGSDLNQWETTDGEPAQWTLNDDGSMTVKPGTGGIQTKQAFCDVQLHVEWRAPTVIEEGMDGQNRGNSGVFLQQRYEVQVLDSYNNRTYANGQAASIYKQHIPLVNAMRPTGEWQDYDIIFQAPRFTGQGDVDSPAHITVLHNGVLVQNHVEVKGTTAWIGEPSYESHDCAPLYLQDHGDLVSFRNIWIREL